MTAMRFTYYPSREEVERYYGTDETLMMLVSFDGERAVDPGAPHAALSGGDPGDGD